MTAFTVACLAGAAICALGALAATRLPGRQAPGPVTALTTGPGRTQTATTTAVARPGRAQTATTTTAEVG